MTPRTTCLVTLTVLALTGCRPSDVLDVPPPIGVIAGSTLANQSGAESELAGATAQLYQSIANYEGLLEVSEVLTDEFTWGYYANYYGVGVDARYTAETGAAEAYPEIGAGLVGPVLGARSSLLIAEAGLRKYEPASGQSKIGEAYALIGYSELIMAETFCAGTPLSVVLPGGGTQAGTSLTTDSLLGTAEAHFDSALAHAGGNDSVVGLASVGLGRTRLDRGHFAAAASVVSSVPTGFVFNIVSDVPGGSTSQVDLYSYPDPSYGGCSEYVVADREGGTGLNYISAGDARLVFDTTVSKTCDGGTWYYPVKFGSPSRFIPLATGVEARLIAAEAALQGGNASTWAADLNALRIAAPNTYLALASSMDTLTSDSTSGAPAVEQLDVMFRERAFWLFGTGTRLGDLRRLIRQYGRDQSTVFPSGAYVNGNNPNLPSPLPTYGTDVSISLPTAKGGSTTTNSNYKGCLSPPSTA
ncbi:MAG TPA: hypothetical protein VNW46_00500 [Gemmatimonadaceae bacterium]|jgi:hypothetical protein|nr:hypothetical protein [Gemmatimonadaceae bacterium]